MAGMLPGVEAARIRRFHQSNLGSSATRRSSFCLYAAGHQEFRISSPSSVVGNPMSLGECDDENLEDAAREAKERLDQRLRSYWKSEIKRTWLVKG